jgi:iron complex transport system substrate-binding protein
MERTRGLPGIRLNAPQRIVSLAPNVTSILLALGAGRELIGVSKWCKHVAPTGRRPQVGDCWKLDLDEVMRLKPTVLIGSVPFASETVAQILKQPVTFLAINPRSLADIENDIRTLGQLVDHAAAAESLILRMRRALAEVARRATKIRGRAPRPRVYCEAWPKPRISSPPWVAELIHIAGGQMALPPGERVSDEEVARAKPEVIVLAWTATAGRANPNPTLQNPLWKDIPAVKSRRVVVIRDELLNTPGPPLMQGARELLRAIHFPGIRRA